MRIRSKTQHPTSSTTNNPCFLKTQTDSKKRLLRQKNIFEQMEKPKVTLIYNDVKREILRRTMMKAVFFADHYENGKDFYREGPYSQECFSDF